MENENSNFRSDWVWVLRYSVVMARQANQKSDFNYFKKIADHEGVSDGDPAPRTRWFQKEWNHRACSEVYEGSIKLFAVGAEV